MNVYSYRARPVIIEAVQWDGSMAMADGIEVWSNGVTQCYARWAQEPELKDTDKGLEIALYITTPEGTMRADPRDWIAKGTRGEFYAIKPDVFAANYEKVVEA